VLEGVPVPVALPLPEAVPEFDGVAVKLPLLDPVPVPLVVPVADSHPLPL
jgi:hypothetical protein